MTDTRTRLEPGPDHPITVSPHAGHVTVQHGPDVIAETDRALELQESNYPVVLYIPVEDVNHALLGASGQHTYCPYKGEASYYDLLPGVDDSQAGAVWYYPEPYDAVDAIRGHVAFYADRVTITSQS
jgi:uncharacterized protein (DUF427 family)